MKEILINNISIKNYSTTYVDDCANDSADNVDNVDSVDNVDVDNIDDCTKKYVDLDLPSGILWATMNLGAYRPTSIGTKYTYEKATEKFFTRWMDYDDVIHYITNGWARLPKKKDVEELIENTNWEWVEKEQGVKLISKLNPKKYIFIPGIKMEYYNICSFWTSDNKESNVYTCINGHMVKQLPDGAYKFDCRNDKNKKQIKAPECIIDFLTNEWPVRGVIDVNEIPNR